MATITRSNPRRSFIAQEIITDAKQYTLDRSQQRLRQQQTKGFPTDPDEYQVFVKQRGRLSRRTFSTIAPEFLNVPYSIIYQDTGSGQLFEAFTVAKNSLAQTVPEKSGHYRRAIDTFFNLSRKSDREIERKIANGLRKKDRIQIIATAPYSAYLEIYYLRKRRRLLLKTARDIRAQFGTNISIRFAYAKSDKIGVVFPGGKIYDLPMIEFGEPGAFVTKDRRPGARLREHKTGARGTAPAKRKRGPK